MNSRLFQDVRAKAGLTYDVHSFFSQQAIRGVFAIQAQTKRGQSQQVKTLIANTTRTFLEHGPSATEMKRAKAQIRSGFLTRIAANGYLVNRIAMDQFYRRAPDSLSGYLDRLAKLNPSTVQQAMLAHVKPNDWVVVTVGGA